MSALETLEEVLKRNKRPQLHYLRFIEKTQSLRLLI